MKLIILFLLFPSTAIASQMDQNSYTWHQEPFREVESDYVPSIHVDSHFLDVCRKKYVRTKLESLFHSSLASLPNIFECKDIEQCLTIDEDIKLSDF